MTVQPPTEQSIRRANLRRAWRLYCSGEHWNEADRERLFRACFEEWGVEWVKRVQEEQEEGG